MISKMAFNYNVSDVVEILKENGACRVVFGSDSSLFFEDAGACFVEVLRIGSVISINVESVSGDKICRSNIDIGTRKCYMYIYDRSTDEEQYGEVDEWIRNDVLKYTKRMYDRRVGIYKKDKNLNNYKYLEFVADDGSVYRDIEVYIEI